jgi:hypothetical protein
MTGNGNVCTAIQIDSMPFLRLGVDSMGKKKFALLGVCVMLCLLIMSAMSGSLLGYSNAWFTSSAQADASITANFLTLDDIVEINIAENITNPGNGKGDTGIGFITSLKDGLILTKVEFFPPDAGPSLLAWGGAVSSAPAPEIVLKKNDSVSFTLRTHFKGNTPAGTYKGKLVLTFSFEGVEYMRELELKVDRP